MEIIKTSISILTKNCNLTWIIIFTLSLTLLSYGDEQIENQIKVLIEPTYLKEQTSLVPSKQFIDSVTLQPEVLLKTPRAVSLIDKEKKKLFEIHDFTDLEKISAGTQRYNFFGIAGTPALRGWEAGVYYNGMLRAYQRNTIPTQFNSIEKLELVKGIAPAQYSPTSIGGYVNLIPKSASFDNVERSVSITVGNDDFYKAKIDVGGPTQIFAKFPAAFHVSIATQHDNTAYNNVNNDFFSAYSSVKAKTKPGIEIFTGAEYSDYKSNENVGWNRPTQNLIDHNQYVIGEPLSLSRTSLGGRADRNLIDYIANGPLTNSRGEQTPFTSEEQRQHFKSLVISEATAIARIPDSLRSHLIDLSQTDVYGDLLTDFPDLLPSLSGFLYTPEYFANGGFVLTDSIDTEQVLSDSMDFADAHNFLYFFDVLNTRNPDRTVTYKNFIEYYKTDKRSTYGFAFRSEQFVFNNRLVIAENFDGLPTPTRLTYGLEFRYTHALQLEDFWTEPFARRDLTQENISGNSQVLSGTQVDPNNNVNFWAGGTNLFGGTGTNNESDLFQYGLFALFDVELTERLHTYLGLRAEIARFQAKLPSEVDFTFQQADGNPLGQRPSGLRGQKNNYHIAFNPVYKLTDDIALYGAIQYGTTFTSSFAGTVSGESSFAEGELYELGAKASLLDDRFYTALSIYYWDQGAFDERNQVNEQFRAKGFEVETAFEAAKGWTLLGSFTAQKVYRRTPLGFRIADFSVLSNADGNAEQGIALNGGVLNPSFDGAPVNNPDLVVPGAPQVTVKLFTIFELPNRLGVSVGALWRDAFWHNYDRTLHFDSTLSWNVVFFYKSQKWEVRFGIENLTDEDIFLSADPEFAANGLITKAPGREYRLTLTYKW